ncbi:MAG: hypothetical protein RL698_849 [Pseudomonadota bacterium]
MAYVEDTIAAVATAPGPGAIAIVRLSGPQAFALSRKVCIKPDGSPVDFAGSHRARLAHVVDPSSRRVIDQVLLLPMRGPRSYTGEDSVELHCHGGDLVPRLVLGSLLRAGARPARPGEFTERAFLNGKIDLCQAEAVAELVRASSEAAAELAQSHLEGWLSDSIQKVRDRLLDARCLVEAHLDFPEDDIPVEVIASMDGSLDDARSAVRELLSTYERGRLVRDGARVVLLGRPNVGKSSLLNSLLGRNRALVSREPGTTRDFLEESLTLGDGLRIILVDTAGLRESESEVERAGIEQTRELALSSDAAIALFDGSTRLSPEDREVSAIARSLAARGVPILAVRNKADLPPSPWLFADLEADEGATVEVSAMTGQGLPELCCSLEHALAAHDGDSSRERPVICLERHRSALERAAEALREISSDQELEVVAQGLQRAAFELESILGHATTEEVLDRIFERFCIGK